MSSKIPAKEVSVNIDGFPADLEACLKMRSYPMLAGSLANRPDPGDVPIGFIYIDQDNYQIHFNGGINWYQSQDILRGTEAERPSAGKTGRLFLNTNLKQFNFDTGSEWITVGFTDASTIEGALIGAERFQISGNISGDNSVSVQGELVTSVQSIFINMPAGKILTLKRVRFNLYGNDFRLQISQPGDLTPYYTSTATGEETPDIIIYDNSGSAVPEPELKISVGIRNISTSNLILTGGGTGWWADLEISNP